MRQLKRQDRTKDMHLERIKKEASFSASGSPSGVEKSNDRNKWRQTEDKVETTTTDMSPLSLKSRDKVESQPRTQPETKWRQTEDKVETTTTDMSPLSLKSRDKVESQPRTQPETKWRQTEDKVETILGLSSLVGLQRNLVILIYQSCKAARSSTTQPLTIEYISKACETSASSAKKTIQRLEKKGALKRVSFKDGRGGWTTYELEKSIYQDLLRAETEDKLETKWRQTEDKVESQLETQPRTSPLGSKVDNINNNYLTTTDDWNFEMLHNIEKYGITSSVLKRAREISPSLQVDQASLVIEKFSVRMESDAGRSIKNPIGYFLSLTKRAASGEDILPEIETESDRLMREMVEKAQEVLKKRAEIEAELLESSFLVWMGGLDSAQKREIAPNSTLVKEGSHPYTQHFKNYYKENLWPKEKEIMLQGKV